MHVPTGKPQKVLKVPKYLLNMYSLKRFFLGCSLYWLSTAYCLTRRTPMMLVNTMWINSLVVLNNLERKVAVPSAR